MMRKRNANLIDMTGRKIGCWRVLGPGRKPRGSQSDEAWWKCRCVCGEIRNKAGGELRAGRTLSCGCATDVDWCLRSFGVSTINMPEYHIWGGILSRCTNENDDAYARYGGRGITVCDRWTPHGEKRRTAVRVRYTRSARRVAFMNFIKDMGRRPSSAHSVERKDNNKGYSKSNCVWATDVVQMNNRGAFNRRLTFRGETLTAAQWARKLPMPYATIIARAGALGWSDERTLSTPVKKSARSVSDPDRVGPRQARRQADRHRRRLRRVYAHNLRPYRSRTGWPRAPRPHRPT